MRQFHINHILAVTHTLFLPRDGEDFNVVYDILNYLTGDDLFTCALPRAADECKPHVLAQLPFMRQFDGAPKDVDAMFEWARMIATLHGEYHGLVPCSEAHQVINPIMELGEMVGDKPIVVINPEEQPDG